QRPQADPLGRGGQRRQERPCLHARPVRFAVQGLEVIEDQRAVEPELLGQANPGQHLRPVELMLVRLQPETHCGAPGLEMTDRARPRRSPEPPAAGVRAKAGMVTWAMGPMPTANSSVPTPTVPPSR